MTITPDRSSSSGTVDWRDRRWLWVAFAWGLAEATVFFIVPDVWTSHVVMRRTRLGFLACLAALAGALIGGSLWYWVGTSDSLREIALSACSVLPGIDSALVAQAKVGLGADGTLALFTGVLGGVPYKLYALQVAPAGIGFGAFLVSSLAARLTRFVAVTTLAWFASGILLRKLPIEAKLRIHAAMWTVFYAGYFWRMGL